MESDASDDMTLGVEDGVTDPSGRLTEVLVESGTRATPSPFSVASDGLPLSAFVNAPDGTGSMAQVDSLTESSQLCTEVAGLSATVAATETSRPVYGMETDTQAPDSLRGAQHPCSFPTGGETHEPSELMTRPLPLASSKGNALSSNVANSVPDTSQMKFEEFINSPRGQNAIVERSPGGRYVRFLEKLGSGASKDVYRAYDTTEGIEVAWNVVNLSGVPKTERNRIVNEVRLLERLHHHNIISFHGSWVNRERQEVNFVTEILSSGTLKSFINKVQVIRWKIAKRWAVQILKGLEYLHSQDPPVIHRDLKCENIFINGTSGDLRIGDLGLSTVHRNGKVLSVLGTPEFMAPDLYEEAAYDEKVDIYAFGMCLLEIFTKEIPYRECSNPAQIYKKVMRGEPPESLARVRSREARDFIMLCLGRKGGDGKYVRPSATELLIHPFLAKGVDDDSEVEIDPPIQERVISEASEESFSSSDLVGPASRPQRPADKSDESIQPLAPSAYRDHSYTNNTESKEASSVSQLGPPSASHANESPDEDDSDKFSEMPVSEVNIKKVKVLMGRGRELEENSTGQPPRTETVSGSEGRAGGRIQKRTEDSADISLQNRQVQGSSSSLRSESSSVESNRSHVGVSPSHYLVAAAVIEEESPLSRPYPDDMLKLIVTLPVEGQTQNVQFDFHLVQDDPVKVAKEMVTELHIPQEAVLEISETISGLACSARMKQDKYNNYQKQVLGHNHAIHPRPMTVQQDQQQSKQQLVKQEQHRAQIVQDNSTTTNASKQPVSDPRAGVTLPIDASIGQNIALPQGSLVTIAADGPHQESPHSKQQATPTVHQSLPTSDAECTSANEFKPEPPLLASVAPTLPPVLGTNQPRPTPFVAAARIAATPVSVTDDSQEVSHLAERIDDAETDSEGESELTEELRRLDEDFQKNLLRAQRVFDSRMDSLHRSKEEREAQHLKTLEKHEKERAEFEKRLEAEAKEQSRRMEQLQREWDRQRESLAKQRDVVSKRKHQLNVTDSPKAQQVQRNENSVPTETCLPSGATPSVVHEIGAGKTPDKSVAAHAPSEKPGGNGDS